jgi:hypothetical protein
MRTLNVARGFALAAALAGSASAVLLAADKDDRARDKLQFQIMRIYREMIDDSVYGIYRNESGCREWLEASLRLKADEIKRDFGLSDRQKEKLELAGKGDIDRFLRRVELLKETWPPGQIPQVLFNFNVVAPEWWPLSQALEQGLFESGSLFHKVLSTALRPDQVVRYGQIDSERRMYRYKAHLELVVMQLDSFLSLSDDQRGRLMQLVLEKTRPLRCSDGVASRVVLAQMSNLSEGTLKPLFDSRQWRQLQPKLATARGDMLKLKQLGIAFGDESKAGEKAPLP